MTLREKLQVPLAIVLIVSWMAALLGALISDKLPVFVIVAAPFGLFCRWVLRVSIAKDGGDDDGG